MHQIIVYSATHSLVENIAEIKEGKAKRKTKIKYIVNTFCHKTYLNLRTKILDMGRPETTHNSKVAYVNRYIPLINWLEFSSFSFMKFLELILDRFKLGFTKNFIFQIEWTAHMNTRMKLQYHSKNISVSI